MLSGAEARAFALTMQLYSSSKQINSIDEIAHAQSVRFPYEIDLAEPGCDLKVYRFPTWRDGVAFSRGFRAAAPDDKVETALFMCDRDAAMFLVLDRDSAGDGAVEIVLNNDLKYE